MNVPTEPEQVTEILAAIRAGRETSANRLLPAIVSELRKLARIQMAHERPQTLQPTALVNEAYLRLLGGRRQEWVNRAHFYGAAAEAMRRILIERARRVARLKRGGERQRVELQEGDLRIEPGSADMLALDQALSRLEVLDSEMANVVKLRYFAGLTVAETAKALDISPRSVNRGWTRARVWLKAEIERGGRAEADPDRDASPL